MHLTLLYTMVSTVLLLQPTLAATIPSELQPRACPKQDFDPKRYLCGGDSGKFSHHSSPRPRQNQLVLYLPSKAQTTLFIVPLIGRVLSCSKICLSGWLIGYQTAPVNVFPTASAAALPSACRWEILPIIFIHARRRGNQMCARPWDGVCGPYIGVILLWWPQLWVSIDKWSGNSEYDAGEGCVGGNTANTSRLFRW